MTSRVRHNNNGIKREKKTQLVRLNFLLIK